MPEVANSTLGNRRITIMIYRDLLLFKIYPFLAPYLKENRRY